ncbi:MAG TPA: hypothetical protein VGG72_09475 [Bryobacteraceae bacterium]|jgi:hypothetical protein
MSYKIVRVLAAAGLCASAALAGVDPTLVALVMPDAKMLIGFQVGQAQSTPLGQYLLSQVQLDPNVNRVMTAAGFDPRKDLREILAATGDSLNGLVLGRGSFQPAKILKAAAGAGATQSTYRGVEMLTFPALSGAAGPNHVRNQPAASIAFLDSSTFAAGDTEAVKGAIGRRGAAAVVSGELAEKAREISVANDAWVATLTPPTGLSNPGRGAAAGPFQNVLQSALQLSAGIKFAVSQVTLSAEVTARSPQDAQSMADLMKLLAGMLQASRSQDPNASKGASMADAARISSSGSVMYLVIAVPERDLEQFFIPSQFPAADQPKKVAMGAGGTAQVPTETQTVAAGPRAFR